MGAGVGVVGVLGAGVGVGFSAGWAHPNTAVASSIDTTVTNTSFVNFIISPVISPTINHSCLN